MPGLWLDSRVSGCQAYMSSYLAITVAQPCRSRLDGAVADPLR